MKEESRKHAKTPNEINGTTVHSYLGENNDKNRNELEKERKYPVGFSGGIILAQSAT